MRRSEFLRAVDVEFGARGSAIVNDLVLSGIGRTSSEALDAGVPPRDIWWALCADMDVPVSHRHGAGRLEPRR
ncbi:DUF3046 domain-containing protein [Microbacterium betulae]|uniref:DUF3046 domain-containing protein n=1 Tax=Microbacterium betulae TaxID=2981139 RepID=A0AA97I5X9_9MICO|nr:DUF3046 domain-containing protein [Microbacterium sp. AB]WOF22022.1 DUF3046 domain-containing protein [Microbacterium sp. AB]